MDALAKEQVMAVIKLAHALRGDPNNSLKPFNTDPNRPLRVTRPSDFKSEDLSEYMSNPKRVALEEFLTALSVDARRELLAPMWIGRGDYADWKSAMANARRSHPDGHFSYIMGRGPSASTFSTAFSRHVGRPPRQSARMTLD